MLPKNFLNGQDKKKSGDRLLWVIGLAAVLLFAVLASGTFDGKKPVKRQEGSAADAVTAGFAALEAASKSAADPETLPNEKPTLGRSSRGRSLSAPEGPGFASIGRTLGALGLILVLLFGGAAVGARFLKKLRMKPQGEKVLELVDCIALGPKRQVFVVSAYGRKIVVGATGESMSVLSEFDQDEIAVATSTTPEAKSFERRLEQNLERGEKQTPAFALEMKA